MDWAQFLFQCLEFLIDQYGTYCETENALKPVIGESKNSLLLSEKAFFAQYRL